MEEMIFHGGNIRVNCHDTMNWQPACSSQVNQFETCSEKEWTKGEREKGERGKRESDWERMRKKGDEFASGTVSTRCYMCPRKITKTWERIKKKQNQYHKEGSFSRGFDAATLPRLLSFECSRTSMPLSIVAGWHFSHSWMSVPPSTLWTTTSSWKGFWCRLVSRVPLMRGSVHSFHLALNLSALVLLLHRGRRYGAAYPRVRSLGRSYISSIQRMWSE